jgi:hypothetical protein
VVGLKWRDDSAGKTPRSALIKYVDMGKGLLGASATSLQTWKAARTIKSFENELVVLQNLVGPLRAAGINVPEIFSAEGKSSCHGHHFPYYLVCSKIGFQHESLQYTQLLYRSTQANDHRPGCLQ